MKPREKAFSIIIEKLRFFLFYFTIQDLLFSTIHELSHHFITIEQTNISLFSYLISLFVFLVLMLDLINYIRINQKLRNINEDLNENTRKLENLDSRIVSAAYKIDQRTGSQGSILTISSLGVTVKSNSTLSTMFQKNKKTVFNENNIKNKSLLSENSLEESHNTSLEYNIEEDRGVNIDLREFSGIKELETNEYVFNNKDYLSLLRLRSYEKKHVSLVEFFRDGMSPKPGLIDNYYSRRFNLYFVVKSLLWIPVLVTLQMFPITQIIMIFLIEGCFFVFMIRTAKYFRKIGNFGRFVIFFNQVFFNLFLAYGLFFEIFHRDFEILEEIFAIFLIIGLVINFIGLIFSSLFGLRMIFFEIRRGARGGDIDEDMEERNTNLFDNLIDSEDRYWGKKSTKLEILDGYNEAADEEEEKLQDDDHEED